MCLDNLDPKPMRKYGIGYKSLMKRIDGSYVCYDHIPNAGKIKYPLNQWITDPQGSEAEGWGGRPAGYKTGFHVCLDKEGTQHTHHTMVKVRFRKVTATQCQHPSATYGRVVVAREVMNLGEV